MIEDLLYLLYKSATVGDCAANLFLKHDRKPNAEGFARAEKQIARIFARPIPVRISRGHTLYCRVASPPFISAKSFRDERAA